MEPSTEYLVNACQRDICVMKKKPYTFINFSMKGKKCRHLPQFFRTRVGKVLSL